MEREQKLTSEASREVREKLLKEVLVLEDRISAEEAELLETSEEMKELMMERRNMKAEEWTDSDHRVVVSSQLAESGDHAHFDAGWERMPLRELLELLC